MKDYVSNVKDYVSNVSNWIDLVLLVALTFVVVGIFVPVFPFSSLVFVTIVAATVFLMSRRTAHRSTTQVISDVQAEKAVGDTAPAKRSPLIARF